MNTNILKSVRWWAPLLCCCALLSTARAQDATPAQSANPAASAAQAAPAAQPASAEAAAPPSAAPEATSPDANAGSDSGSDTDSDADSHSDSQSKHHHHHSFNDINIGAHDDDAVVSVGHSAELPAGQRAQSVVAVFGSATSAGDVGDSVVSVMGRTRITGGRVANSAVAVMGSIYINGEVDGDVVAVLGGVELGPEARVRGNIVIIGGQLQKDPAATLEGHVETIFNLGWSNFEWLQPWIDRCLLYGRPLAFAGGLGWAWSLALVLLALYVFIAFLFRGAVERCVHTLEEHPGPSIVAVLLTMLLTPVLVVLLCITVLGIAAIPFLIFGLFAATVFGKIVVLAFIGRRCTPMLANDPVMHTVVGVLVGGAIALVVYTIPIIGFIVYKLLGILGLGVVMYTLLITLRASRQTRAVNGGSGPRPGAGPGGGGPGAGGSPPGSGGAGPGGAGYGGSGAAYGSSAGAAGYGGSAAGAPGAAGYGSSGAMSGATGYGGAAAGAADFGAADFGAGSATGAAGAPGASGVSGAESVSGAAGDESVWAGRGMGTGPVGGSARSEFAEVGSSDHARDNFGAGGAGGGAGGFGGPGGPGAGGPSGMGGPGGPTRPGGLTGAAEASAAAASLPRAGFAIRIAALLLDVLLVGIVLHGIHESTRLELLILATYGAVMWKLKGSTIGGIICGLRVVRLDGRPIDWPTAIARALSCFLSLAVVGLGFLWIAIDADRQAWHDKIAGTVVVRAPKGASLL